jgi:hypothetical protein
VGVRGRQGLFFVKAPVPDGGGEHDRLAFIDVGVDFGQFHAQAQQLRA